MQHLQLSKDELALIAGSLKDSRAEQESDLHHFEEMMQRYDGTVTTMSKYAKQSMDNAIERLLKLDKLIVRFEINEQFPHMQSAARPKAYLCGKVTGLPYDHVICKFEELEDRAKHDGYDPVNPLKIVNDPDAHWSVAMSKCIEVLPACQRVYVSSDWVDSRGAKVEIMLAYLLQKHVIFSNPLKDMEQATDMCLRIDNAMKIQLYKN